MFLTILEITASYSRKVVILYGFGTYRVQHFSIFLEDVQVSLVASVYPHSVIGSTIRGCYTSNILPFNNELSTLNTVCKVNVLYISPASACSYHVLKSGDLFRGSYKERKIVYSYLDT